MLLVGLTGGIASGKTTVARMLAGRGAVVVDADDLARRAVDPGTEGLRRVTETFGAEVIAADGSLDRARMAQVVFADPEKRVSLEAIIHPEVFRMLGEVVSAHRGTHDVVVFDAPLIFETGFDRACDLVVVVSAAPSRQIERVVRDRGMTEGEARARIEAQVPAGERESRGDVVLRNEGTLEELEAAVGGLWSELERRARA